MRAIITPLCDWVKSRILISHAQFLAKTRILQSFHVDKAVDNFGDNGDNSPVLVDKWGIIDVMSCCIQHLCMGTKETYPHIHRERTSLAI